MGLDAYVKLRVDARPMHIGHPTVGGLIRSRAKGKGTIRRTGYARSGCIILWFADPARSVSYLGEGGS